jgi:hypothetical protein
VRILHFVIFMHIMIKKNHFSTQNLPVFLMSLTLTAFKYYMISKTVATKIEQLYFDNTVSLFLNVIYKLVLLLNLNTKMS